MKEKLKQALGLVLSMVLAFIFIYLFVFLGGWKYFESGDPIKIEIGVAIVLGAVIWFMLRLYGNLSSRIDKLEEELKRNYEKER